MVLLLRMRSGSHLYGTNTSASDEDWFEVYDRLPGRRQSAQKIAGDQDVTSVGLRSLGERFRWLKRTASYRSGRAEA